jgi:hypothetical protein
MLLHQAGQEGHPLLHLEVYRPTPSGVLMEVLKYSMTMWGSLQGMWAEMRPSNIQHPTSMWLVSTKVRMIHGKEWWWWRTS